MNIRKLWDGIIDNISDVCIELSTDPKNETDSACFNISTDGKTIYFDCSVIDESSSRLEIHRKLNYKTFQNSYQLFKTYKINEPLDVSIKQLYYYSEINI